MGLTEFTLEQIEHVRRLPEVNWVDDPDLPAIFTVKEAPGVFYLNVAKWFDYDAVALKPEIVPSSGIPSIPNGDGGRRIVNLIVVDGKLKVEYDDGNP